MTNHDVPDVRSALVGADILSAFSTAQTAPNHQMTQKLGSRPGEHLIELTPPAGSFPQDWPGAGPIDLVVQDLPHASSTMEWWYLNTHVTATDGRRLAIFAAFFRVDVTEEGAPERTFAHFLTWALTDLDRRRYFPHTLLDPRAPEIALREIESGRGPRDDRLSRALREVLARGRVPAPDRLLSRDAHVELTRLSLDLDGNRLRKGDDGSYSLELDNGTGREGCCLRFALDKPVVRHGDDGVVRGVGGEDMFYYFSPQCSVEGTVFVDGERIELASGQGWFDHEFGTRHGEPDESVASSSVGWNWLAAQLDNGYEVSAYDLFARDDLTRSQGRWLIVVDPAGERRAYREFSFQPSGAWTSTKTFNEYPTSYIVDVPDAALSLDVTVDVPGQEIITIISAPGFWEGAVSIAGTMNGAAVRGRGFVERRGVSVADSTDEFFASVGRETRRAIDALLPDPLNADQALRLIGSERRRHFLDGLDLEQYSRTVVRPIREIILRGGKAWRSYGLLACMDLVGGDSQPFSHWLALPELLHVGSLIIDDVQDDSDIRRGGPACHKLYGDALAINAGCASYFLAQLPVADAGLPDAMLVRIYDAYFEAVRAAHAGQAADIDGLWRLLPAVVESGDGALLERRVLAVHRLKSAAPAGALARMATLIGGGSDEQAEGVGHLFESLGVAFQIIDDVLNLRGFESGPKSHGEDLTAGKITAPVAKAMGRLAGDDRRQLASILGSGTSDRAVIAECASMIERTGAFDACERDARDLVEAAWRRVDPLVPDSHFKVRLRAFGWFVLDRHY